MVYIQKLYKQRSKVTCIGPDYSRLSDADDLIGYWRVEQIQDSPPLTRVDYATDMKLSGVPDFLASYLTKDALINGT